MLARLLPAGWHSRWTLQYLDELSCPLPADEEQSQPLLTWLLHLAVSLSYQDQGVLGCWHCCCCSATACQGLTCSALQSSHWHPTRDSQTAR